MIVKHIHKSERWPDFRTGCRSKIDCVQLIRYLLRASAKPTILKNDFAGDCAEDIGDELENLHEKQNLWAYHVVASYPKGEEALWEPQSQERIRELQERCGISHALWVRHKGHWHGLLMAMKPNGGTVRLGTYNEHGEPVPVALAFKQMAQRWEDETPGCQKTGRKGRNLDLSRDSLAAAQRQYLAKESASPIPKKLMLKSDVDRIVALSHSFEQLHATAEAACISIVYRKDDGGKILGISFSKDGVSLRGREAGYSYPQLIKLYGNTPTSELSRSLGMAGRTLGTHRHESRRETSSRPPAADRNHGIDSGTGEGSERPHTGRHDRIKETVRIMNRTPTLLDLLLDLSLVVTRVLNQNDYRRPFHRSNRPNL